MSTSKKVAGEVKEPRVQAQVTLVPVEAIPARAARGATLKMVQSFLSSGDRAAEVRCDNPKTKYAGVATYLRQHPDLKAQVKVSTRQGKLYIERVGA